MILKKIAKFLFNRVFYVIFAMAVQLGWLLTIFLRLVGYSRYMSFILDVISILVVLKIVNHFRSYYKKRDRYYEIANRYNLNQTIIDNAAQDETNRQKRIQDLNELIDKNKKLIDYANLQNSINEMLTGSGGIDDRLAGNKFVKDKIRKFIENIKTSKDNENAYALCSIVWRNWHRKKYLLKSD